jgi:hypothetical protein
MDGTDGHFSQNRQVAELLRRLAIEHSPKLLGLLGERPRTSGGAVLARATDDQIEILLARGTKIAHFVIQTVRNETFLNVSPQKVAVAQQVEEDAPARNLGVVIAAGVVLPTIIVLEAARARHERIDEDLRPEHVEDVSRESPAMARYGQNSRCL